MPTRNGREIADNETTYKLAKLLCEHGCIHYDLLLKHQVGSLNYRLDVKTTTFGSSTHCYISKAQYQKVSQDLLLRNHIVVFQAP